MESWLESFARAAFLRGADTAHDLKTPLNVAVLNLELLRMRLRKVLGDEDEKLAAYASAIELELRRMGRIFDAYFLLSTPPKNEGEPTAVNISALASEAASAAGIGLERAGEAAFIEAHESRIRQALKLFFEGATKVLASGNRRASLESDASTFTIVIAGAPETDGSELTKLFKFYYSDPQGNPDLSIAVARLIAETYGGELDASDDRDKVSLRLSFPLGAR